MATTKTKYKWEGAGTKLPSGHTIIETHNHPDGARWAIFDDSGRTPEESDDGIMWLDRNRPLNASTIHAPVIPIITEGGVVNYGVRVDTPTLLMLSRMFRWTIVDEVRGHYYNVT